jgi:hypothetical protein
MPSFNQARFIVEAVRSILAQDVADWELWIVDNSTDNTPEVMQQFTDPRIRFHHIPKRMDPGSCLNWMLERSTGREFSYVHTDNNLHPSFVRVMRDALRTHNLALAYCDMQVIDEGGNYLRSFTRGSFDFPRLLSVDTLGVPFAATVELATRLGGFSVGDVADDVRFCVGAYGLAHYVYVPENLVDYRLHGGSRTEEAGGDKRIQRVIAELMPKVMPVLEQRGLQPVAVLAQTIKDRLDDVDKYVADCWDRELAKIAKAWWSGPLKIDHFFFAGLVDIPGFTSEFGRPPRGQFIRNESGRIRVMPWTKRTLRHCMRRCRDDLHLLLDKTPSMLQTWALMALNAQFPSTTALAVGSLDFRTLWVASQLQETLGWKPRVHQGLVGAVAWLAWDAADGSEPVLDCSREVIFVAKPSSEVMQ